MFLTPSLLNQKPPQANPSCLVNRVPLHSTTRRHPSRLQKAPVQPNQSLLAATTTAATISSRRWTGKVPRLFAFRFQPKSKCQKSFRRASTRPLLFLDVRSSQDAAESQGAGSMNDQEDLSDQSEGDSYSYSAPGGEPLSRDPSEPLFDADFQVGTLPFKVN